MVSSVSPLARVVPGTRDPSTARKRVPYGVCLHTTGSGLLDSASRAGVSPITRAIQIYVAMQNGSAGYPWGGPGYVIDTDGSIHQIAPDWAATNHCGGNDRETYLNGAWVKKVSPETLRQWRKAWPKKKSPQHLYPHASPNTDYVGVELIPKPGPYAAGRLRFTEEQHGAAAELARDIAERHRFPAGWQWTSRLLSHEDIQPIMRHNYGGGWDIGFLRKHHFFDLTWVRELVCSNSEER